ncbi:hypothetical protein RB195_020039 [Necator americanus]|uniref:Mos1 transposase HTH domain-containing protein n=1 Tax=Necator americanus TaxID=51031 RepID=A0ABR1CGY3_NECAM
MNRRDYRVIMLYEFKLEHSAAEASRNFGRASGSSLGNEDLERAVEANPEPNTPTLPEDLGVHHRHLAEIGKVKKISRRVPHELTEE